MSNQMHRVLQILPVSPGKREGVGDYALQLARALRDRHGLETIFVAADSQPADAACDFPVFTGLNRLLELAGRDECQHVILHYANYGYQTRGVPFRLRDIAQRLRANFHGRWVTMFHELYAFGPPWRSAFWLYPLQKTIARAVVDASDSCFVSSDVIANEIRRHAAAKPIRLVPVMSNFGEPEPNVLTAAPAKRWAICGGTALVLRSLRSFADAYDAVPQHYAPDQVEVIGGRESTQVRAAIAALSERVRGLSCRYHPDLDATDASALLADCSFAWIDYFGTGKVWPGMIYKSSSFAACSAHGVLSILSHSQPPPPINGDAFPHWYFVSRGRASFPEPAQIAAARKKVYAWYHRHASAECTARAYAEALA